MGTNDLFNIRLTNVCKPKHFGGRAPHIILNRKRKLRSCEEKKRPAYLSHPLREERDCVCVCESMYTSQQPAKVIRLTLSFQSPPPPPRENLPWRQTIYTFTGCSISACYHPTYRCCHILSPYNSVLYCRHLYNLYIHIVCACWER